MPLGLRPGVVLFFESRSSQFFGPRAQGLERPLFSVQLTSDGHRVYLDAVGELL